MEEKQKCDRRVIKTRKAIKSAFVKLIIKKDFNDISIKDIADEADVDRKTVYNYYNGIFEIRDEIENDLISILNGSFEQLDIKKNLQNPHKIFETLTNIINNNIELCSIFFKKDANSNLTNKIVSILTEKVEKSLEESSCLKDKNRIEMISQFVTSGIVRVYQHWFNSDNHQSLEGLSQDLGEVIFYGLNPLIQQ